MSHLADAESKRAGPVDNDGNPFVHASTAASGVLRLRCDADEGPDRKVVLCGASVRRRGRVRAAVALTDPNTSSPVESAAGRATPACRARSAPARSLARAKAIQRRHAKRSDFEEARLIGSHLGDHTARRYIDHDKGSRRGEARIVAVATRGHRSAHRSVSPRLDHSRRRAEFSYIR